ncbi:hypothetical protein QJS10_CPA05g01774 [Acorus calamus]|uniref:Uncharacterized protein n=1 Tax=Acorus calamus TaxID=4465 RepID=A0AAV9EVX7_ACOCL|nr:hypothetical protein QJS10_CPA05g01774 [Acorus calamus]
MELLGGKCSPSYIASPSSQIEPKTWAIDGGYELEESVQGVEIPIQLEHGYSSTPEGMGQIDIENKNYATCRDRPFLFLKEMNLFCGKTTSKGFHAVASNVEDIQDDDDSIGDSDDLKVNLVHLQPVEMWETSQDKQTSDAGCGKDSQKTFVQDFDRCEVEDEGTSKCIRKGKSPSTILVYDGVENMKKILEKDYNERYTLEDCVKVLDSYTHLNIRTKLATAKVLKDINNRIIFMTFREDVRLEWIKYNAITMMDNVYRPSPP